MSGIFEGGHKIQEPPSFSLHRESKRLRWAELFSGSGSPFASTSAAALRPEEMRGGAAVRVLWIPWSHLGHWGFRNLQELAVLKV